MLNADGPRSDKLGVRSYPGLSHSTDHSKYRVTLRLDAVGVPLVN